MKHRLIKLNMTKFYLICFVLSVKKTMLTIHITMAIPETILGNRFSSGKWGSKRPVTGFLSTAGANAAKVGRGLSLKETEKQSQRNQRERTAKRGVRGWRDRKQNFLPRKIASDKLWDTYSLRNLICSCITYLFLLKSQHIPLISESNFFSFPVLQEKHGCKI